MNEDQPRAVVVFECGDVADATGSVKEYQLRIFDYFYFGTAWLMVIVQMSRIGSDEDNLPLRRVFNNSAVFGKCEVDGFFRADSNVG